MIQKILYYYFMAGGSCFHQRSESIDGLPGRERLRSDGRQRAALPGRSFPSADRTKLKPSHLLRAAASLPQECTGAT